MQPGTSVHPQPEGFANVQGRGTWPNEARLLGLVQASTYFHNLMMGKRYVAHRGPLLVKCMQTGMKAKAEFREPWHTMNLHGAEKRTFEVSGRPCIIKLLGALLGVSWTFAEGQALF